MVSGTQLMQFSQQFQKYYARQFAPLMERTSLAMRDFHVLLFLINNPDYDTARDITELRGLVKSQVSQAVDLLCARLLLRREPDEQDRRVVHLKLTPDGLALAREAQELQVQCYAHLLEDFSPQEEQQFSDLLSRMFRNGAALADASHPHQDHTDRRPL